MTTDSNLHSLNAIFRPRSVALVGATARANTIGRGILENLTGLDFNGVVYPVNARTAVVHSMRAYPRVSAIPEPVDLAIVVVPKENVIETVRDCGEKGVKGVVVISAGFKEVGGEGVAREAELLATLRQYGMRAIGPNCMGVINTDPEVRLNATFSRSTPLSGNIGFITQSGALGDAIIDFARDLNLGFSLFASIGNKADVDAVDMLEYMGADPRTEVILLYLESFGSPRRFIEAARRISRKKPVVIVKSGRSKAGAAAAMSHTGSMAGTDAAVDALFTQCGILRAQSVEELFDVAQALASQPLPRGNRVGIVTNAGGPGIMATDAVSSLLLRVAQLSPKTTQKMAGKVHPDASLRNPVDLIASAVPEHYATAVKAMLADAGVDMLLAIFVPIVMVDHREMAEAIVNAWLPHKGEKPLVVCLMGRIEGAARGVEVFHRNRVPVYEFPESAARAFAQMVDYVAAKERLEREDQQPAYAVNRAWGEKIVANAASVEGGAIPAEDLSELLRAYGIALVETREVNTLEEAAEAAEALGYPIVLKVNAPSLSHKSDVGGVIVDIRSGEELMAAFRKLRQTLKEKRIKAASFVVQRMLKGGKEIIVGVTEDPQLGHLIMCGLGGIYVEEIRDVAFRLPPVTRHDAEEMIASLRGYSLLQGVRGDEAVDLEFLADLLCRVSRLVEDHPNLVELDLNPVIVCPKSKPSFAVDARARVRVAVKG